MAAVNEQYSGHLVYEVNFFLIDVNCPMFLGLFLLYWFWVSGPFCYYQQFRYAFFDMQFGVAHLF